MKKMFVAMAAMGGMLLPGAALAQMFTATVTGQATGFISPGDQLGGEYGGIVYAGTLDGVTPLFVTRCDYGMVWNPDTDVCGGTRGLLAYGSYGVVTGATSVTDGASNTNTLAARSDTPAAKYCADLAPPDVNSHGYGDWYLPSANELELLKTHYVAIGNVAAGSSYLYWSSTENTYVQAYYMRITSASGGTIKSSPYYIRCMRRGN